MTRPVTLTARPESLPLDLDSTALIVNDMQNAFCSKGGYLDLIGFDLGGVDKVVSAVARAVNAARAAGLPVFLLQNGFAPDLRDVGGPGAPIHHKSNALRYMRAHPETQGTILTEGSWDFDFVAELAPRPGDLVLRKSRDSGFAGTALDQMLRARGIRTVAICGIASNVGVESTLRAAYHLEYFPIMLADATMPAGPPEVQRATEFNVERFFGWVASTGDFADILGR